MSDRGEPSRRVLLGGALAAAAAPAGLLDGAQPTTSRLYSARLDRAFRRCARIAEQRQGYAPTFVLVDRHGRIAWESWS